MNNISCTKRFVISFELFGHIFLCQPATDVHIHVVHCVMLSFTQGLDSGFSGGTDDMYNVYDKPWRAGGGLADKIYRPSRGMDKDLYGDDVEKLIKTSRYMYM